MNNKKATLTLMILLAGIAIIYVKSAWALDTGRVADYNKSTYPLILGGILIVLIVVDSLQSFKEKAQHIAMTNKLFMVGTIVIISLYIFLWNTFGYFYLMTFLVLLALLSMYTNQVKVMKMWVINGVISIAVTVTIYYVFGVLLHINFV